VEQNEGRSITAGAGGTVQQTLTAIAVFVLLATGLAGESLFAGPAGSIHYPDLQVLPPFDIGIESGVMTGRKLLRFSSDIANLGAGPLEIVATNNTATGKTDAYQRLYSHDDSTNWYVANTVYAGTFIFHPQHDHWHFEDFARYELRDAAADGSLGGTVLASSEKVSFCLTDYQLVDPMLEHAGTETYDLCGQTYPQGISVGWADVYAWDLYGQSLDITGLADGDYWLVVTADPDHRLDEGGSAFEDNNTAAVKFHLASDLVWMEDAFPAGAIISAANDSWTWVSSNPAPHSGSLALQSVVKSGLQQYYFYGATATVSVTAGNTLFAYVYLDPANVPSELMLAWSDCYGCAHRAYWGANEIDYGEDGTYSRLSIGPLPPSGSWVRLEVPASRLELEGVALGGLALFVFNGRATWDSIGVHAGPPLGFTSVRVTAGTLMINWQVPPGAPTPTLQEATVLDDNPSDWSTVSGASGNGYSVPVDSARRKFYRLVQD
jgi:hypothetical protein